ncbi:hypothetical protein IEQ34_004601 [Dendrobium chrysotoxum]|uniref:Uncharacterized protein n=1 Tax=Dendrobium chrysotoxum TaxID=161865 RepID=A0AAV7HIN1_DENCH|nr:hypothetical protein IEQ34_004601 [Dendrobium chrysotoxum]
MSKCHQKPECPLDVEELLDIRQKQPTGAELVNEIRRQANDFITSQSITSSIIVSVTVNSTDVSNNISIMINNVK